MTYLGILYINVYICHIFIHLLCKMSKTYLSMSTFMMRSPLKEETTLAEFILCCQKIYKACFYLPMKCNFYGFYDIP